MATFNFADNYRAAGLTASPDVLRTRQAPFDKLRRYIDPSTAVDLARLYFGLSVPGGTDWFRDAFGETDSSFSLVDNAREGAVLAAGLLEAAVADGKAYAGLAVLTTSADGHRQPSVRQDLLDAIRSELRKKAIMSREARVADPKKIKQPATSLTAEMLAQANDVPKLNGLLKALIEESAANSKNLASQVASVIQPLFEQSVILREEVDMLWWYVGGWSRLLDKPIADLPLGPAAVVAGIDMADMSQSEMGPVAAPAVFQRILSGRRDGTQEPIAIEDAVAGLEPDALDLLKLPEVLADVPDVCPLLTAFAKAKQIGRGTAWHAAFSNATGLEASTALPPLRLAMQAYRERLLLRKLV